MATAQQVITSGRYDLADTAPAEYDSDELLEYLNRAIFQLDYALSNHASDLVASEDDAVALASGANSAAVPANTIIVTDVWIGTTQLYPLTPASKLLYERKYCSSTQQPYYWCQIGQNIEFESTADQAYTLDVYYDKKTGALSLTDSMPYNDQFNDALRQAMVIQAKHRNEFDTGMEGQLMDFFSRQVMAKDIMRRYTPLMPEARKLDF